VLSSTLKFAKGFFKFDGRLFTVLIAIYDSDLSPGVKTDTLGHSLDLLNTIILPSLVWRSGKKQSDIRGLASKLLCTLLMSNLLTIDSLITLVDLKLLPLLISNVDDDMVTTRHQILTIFILLFPMVQLWNGYSDVTLVPRYKKIYPELLKRMDDADDQIRIQTAHSFSCLFRSIQDWSVAMSSYHISLDATGQNKTFVLDGEVIELKLDDIHYETIVKGLCLHMDDANKAVQVYIL
jgi:dynein assembly factor 5